MRFFNSRLAGVFTVTALMGGLLLFNGASDASAQTMGGHGWTPAVQTTGSNQAGTRQSAQGYRHGHNNGMHGYSKINTSAGYHNGHGPHAGPYQGCGW